MNDQTSPSAPVVKVDPNEHVREYLSYYIEFKHAPHYAVLLKGVWGIGKTFLIRQILEAYYAGRENTYIYVSLYGLSSYEDLDRALRNAIYPILDNKATVVGTKIAKAALGFFKVNTDINLGDFTSKFKDALYVFDDLERCALPMQKIMGYINEFVEHDSCKVVIIANEEAIKEKSDYFERREKTVGKVLEVQSSINDALKFFLSKIEDSDTRVLLSASSDQIVELFAHSDLHNLRILQQTFWDFERLYKIIDPALRNSETGIGVLLSLFFAFSFDVKSGRLTEKDVATRYNYQWFSFLDEDLKAEEVPTGMAQSIKRYPRVDLTDGILSTEVLTDILFKGLLRQDLINSCLAGSHHFHKTSEQPAWRLAWHLMDMSDEIFTAALATLEDKFLKHEYTLLGEVLHVFGLRLLYSSEGLLSTTREQVFEQCWSYIDHLYIHGKLDTKKPEMLLDRDSGHDGLGFQEAQSSDFKKLVNYLAEKCDQAQKDQYAVWGQEILDDMKNSADIFSKVALQQGVPNPYYRIPVLATIDPAQFVRTWLGMELRAQNDVGVALEGRYGFDMLLRDLKDELPWLHQVERECDSQIGGKAPPTRVRFGWIVNSSVKKVLRKHQLVVSSQNQ
ncbi:MAG: P-loop NTPase fold protein [Acidovorax sp.]|uniref:P-loop NTPase fold protein n=1 Tax=Acidovorax sp. TaxID=1872122 RepID=UPI002626A7FD|nr:P-loop NTPase fold protein [Acidovorax sp.]MDH4418929.1 P-loop NTPase fold protein [Acidovorax sp.]